MVRRRRARPRELEDQGVAEGEEAVGPVAVDDGPDAADRAVQRLQRAPLRGVEEAVDRRRAARGPPRVRVELAPEHDDDDAAGPAAAGEEARPEPLPRVRRVRGPLRGRVGAPDVDGDAREVLEEGPAVSEREDVGEVGRRRDDDRRIRRVVRRQRP